MSGIAKRLARASRRVDIPPLVIGDHLTQAEFHRRYVAYPEDVKFELIGGIVYMASPLSVPHGRFHVKISYALASYAAATPGVEVVDNTTTVLGDKSEPQPDLSMRILSDHGGRTGFFKKKYIAGPPELVAEVAESSYAIDLHRKKQDYQESGVREYIVLCVEERVVRWFDFASTQELEPDRSGVFRSRVYPGLWLSAAALWAGDSAAIARVMKRGLASRAHGDFVKRLAAARRKIARDAGK